MNFKWIDKTRKVNVENINDIVLKERADKYEILISYIGGTMTTISGGTTEKEARKIVDDLTKEKGNASV